MNKILNIMACGMLGQVLQYVCILQTNTMDKLETNHLALLVSMCHVNIMEQLEVKTCFNNMRTSIQITTTGVVSYITYDTTYGTNY